MIKREVVMFLSFWKKKETEYLSMRISKKLKLSQMCKLKIFVTVEITKNLQNLLQDFCYWSFEIWVKGKSKN